ncbi:hypothetical protein EX30DRAFT_394311 [Ascodesmis nigricans]|uniref:VLRF1 domain-containing protein n=1 Tax=Ascodesmis nigricans TaxID=341454 RepID=A0A4S2N1V3_9PEZI|nr:hypothetical protein EX30DRAFT_394311 [Ascodesmis nigricans]
MATATQPADHPLLRRSLYVYDLPKELLDSLVLKSTSATTIEDDSATPASRAPCDDNDVPSATTCQLCSFTGSNVVEQRTHAKSDFHHFNVKQKLRGEPVVGEAEFEKLLEALSESISGSDSDSEASSAADDDSNLSALLRKNATLNSQNAVSDDELPRRRKQTSGNAPLIWFITPQLPSPTSLGIYRALFPLSSQADESYLPYIQQMQLATSSAKTPDKHVVLLMIGGGHFAGMIISLRPKPHADKSGDRSAVVLAHKTFHRYTTRRKQGGAQSANDASKGNAHSAGAGIRRHNEAALMNEVRQLLGDWKQLVDTADLIFIRATGTQNRKILFGYDEAVMKSKDPRIRGFPFSTRRATQKELMRCFIELTRVKVSHIDLDSLAAKKSTDSISTTPTTTPKPTKPKPQPTLSDSDLEAQHHTTQLLSLIRRQKLPSITSYITQNKLDINTFRVFSVDSHRTPTLLHLAASLSLPLVISHLLLQHAASPELLNSHNQPAFDLAGDRDSRDEFRIARHELGEQKWDWEQAHVPKGLTRQEVEERKKREVEEEKRVREKEREEGLKGLERDEEERKKGRAEKKGGMGKALGGVVMTGVGREAEMRGLSEEAKKRLERERRARAAEERIRRMAGGR